MEALIVICTVGSATALVVSLANWRAADRLVAQVQKVEEKQRLAGRKKVRRRNPQTGRFESVWQDEMTPIERM